MGVLVSPANINCLTGCCGCCTRDGDYLNSFDDTVTYPIFTPTATSCDTFIYGSDFDAAGGIVQRHTSAASSALMFCHKEISDFNGLAITFNVTLGTVSSFSTTNMLRFENLKSSTMILQGYFDNIFPPTIRLGVTILATGAAATFASGDVLTMTMTDTGAADGHMDIDFLQNGVSLVTAANVDLKCLFNPTAGGCAGTAIAPGVFWFGLNCASSAVTLEISEYDFSYHY